MKWGRSYEQASARTFTSADYAELATDSPPTPILSGDVGGRKQADIQESRGGGQRNRLSVLADKNSEWNTIVHTDSPPSGPANGYEVRVKGTAKGTRERGNVFGGSVKAVDVDAESVEITKSKGSRGGV